MALDFKLATFPPAAVAWAAAFGLSNRQIAEHLFVTQATVETHLRHAFRKLAITTRTDLPGDLTS